MRLNLPIRFCAASLIMVVGCANLMTKQAIERFSTGLQEQDLDRLREYSSQDFETRALRTAGATQDLKILKVPTGKLKIDSVETVDDHVRKVVVKVGEKEQQRTLEYRLTRDRRTAQWVVDDVTLDPRPDGESPPSIAEQMDLLLSAREFLDEWRGEDRDAKLARCTEDFRGVLETLPPKWMDRLMQQTMGDGRPRTARPEARINGDLAVVVVPHPDGELFIEMRHGETWLVNDAAVQPKGKAENGIPSVKKLARTLNRSAEFLSSYAAVDRQGLQKTATSTFYEQCLAVADLASVSVPVADLLVDDYELRHYPDRRELLLESNDTTYMLTLQQTDEKGKAEETSSPEVRINEITIFEQGGDQVKRVSAMFRSHAVVQLFGRAIYERDLPTLKKLSSTDFNGRVWDHEAAALLGVMPLPEIESPEVRVISTVFRGDTTEVTVSQGSRATTYVLGLQNSWLVVDDVILPSHKRPTSLKKNLELLLPMYAFTSSLYRDDLRGLLTYSADALDKIVWRQVDHVPQLQTDLVSALMLPVESVKAEEPWSIVQLGNKDVGAEVKLVREGKRFVVHDIGAWDARTMTARYDMMQSLRHRLAIGDIPVKTYGQSPSVMQAGAEVAAPTQDVAPATSPIQQSVYEVEVPQ